MGKREMVLDRQEIIKWKNDGWTFRVKTVKGKRYITRRKRNREKSYGRYNERIWNIIKNTIAELSVSEQQVRAVADWRRGKELIKGLLGVTRITHMSKSCAHVIDGYCYFWKYDVKPAWFKIVNDGIGNGYYKQVLEGGSFLWVFKALPFYCENCPEYKSKSNISQIL
jgi:hypothetical protein